MQLTKAARALLRSPGYSLAVLLTLAIVMTASLSVFMLWNEASLHSLPYHNPTDRLVMLWSPVKGQALESVAMTVSPKDFLDWQRSSRSFTALAAFNIASGDLIGGDEPINVSGAKVSPGFFDVLGAGPIIGHTFDSSTSAGSIILSYDLWKKQFNASPAVLGSKITLSGIPYSIIGVMPAVFAHPEPFWDRTAEFWIPFPEGFEATARDERFLRVIGLLRPGITMPVALSEMISINSHLVSTFPASNKDRVITIVPLRRQLYGSLREPLSLLLVISGLIFLIGCLNIANLQLARVSSNSQQLTIRHALGARLHHLFLLTLGESLILAAAGCFVGIIGAEVLTRFLVLRMLPKITTFAAPTPDVRFFFFAAFLAAAASLISATCSIGQLIVIGRAQAARAQQMLQRSASKRLLRNSLVVLQLGLALPLFFATLLLGKSLQNALVVSPGFNPASATTFRLNLPASRYKTPAAIYDFYRELTKRLAMVGGVKSATLISGVPLTGLNTNQSREVSIPTQGQSRSIQAYYRVADINFFSTLGIPLIGGRAFSVTDQGNSPRVCIVNHAFERNYFDGRSAVGKRIILNNKGAHTELEIVGLAGDVHFDAPTVDPAPELYVPFAQAPGGSMAIVFTYYKSTGPVINLQRFVMEQDTRLPVTQVRTIENIVSASTSRMKLAAVLGSTASLIAAILALAGVGSVLAYIVSTRSAEFAIRIALGAARNDLLLPLITLILKLCIGGIVLGLALSATVARIPAHLLYGVKDLDVWTILSAILAVVAVAFLGALFPVRRVLATDAATALRSQT